MSSSVRYIHFVDNTCFRIFPHVFRKINNNNNNNNNFKTKQGIKNLEQNMFVVKFSTYLFADILGFDKDEY